MSDPPRFSVVDGVENPPGPFEGLLAAATGSWEPTDAVSPTLTVADVELYLWYLWHPDGRPDVLTGGVAGDADR